MDLVTPDLAEAEKFYGALFGWTFRPSGAPNSTYAVAFLGDRALAGIVRKAVPPGVQRQPAWLTFIAVRDIGGARRATLAHGGKALTPIRTYAGRGTQAVFADPQGAAFAALQSSSGDGSDLLATPGDWIWAVLLTADAGSSADFYKAVFGYEVFDLPSKDGGQHLVLAADHYARAGIHTLPAGHRHAHWIDFVRVADASRSAAQAVTLGGRLYIRDQADLQ